MRTDIGKKLTMKFKIGMPETLTAVQYDKNRRAARGASMTPEMTPGTDCNVDIDGNRMTLPVMSVKCYDNNPRSSVNPKFLEIKESFRVAGKPRLTLPVTKRPGEISYMVAQGGNTRLLVIQELYQETLDPNFYEIDVIYSVWKSESHVIAGHLIENEARADTTFWDKACGIVSLKDELEKETGERISTRDFEDHLKGLGISIGRSQIQRFLFAIEELGPIGTHLRTEDVKVLKPHIFIQNALARQLSLDTVLYEMLLKKVLEQYARDLVENAQISSVTICNMLDESLANAIDVSPIALRLMMAALRTDPNLEGEALRATGKCGMNIARMEGGHILDSSQDHLPRLGSFSNASIGSTVAVKRIVGRTTTKALPTESSLGFGQQVNELVTRLCIAAQVDDCLRFASDMPIGYYMELPTGPLDEIEVADQQLRRAAWHVMAALSSQFDQDDVGVLPEESAWRNAIQFDRAREQSFHIEFQHKVHGICSADSVLGMAIDDIKHFLWHQRVGPMFQQLTTLVFAWRSAEPQRFGVPNSRMQLNLENGK